MTPAARRRARELDVDLARVRGSGPGGRIVREDVETFAQRIAGRRRVAKGVALEVQSAGEGPPVLLLPGFGTDWTAFARQLPALAERYRAIAVNLRGVGVSDPPAGEVYPVDTAARDALALAESEPAHWIGASWGAAVVLELALRRPEAVRSLTLITPFVSVDGRLDAVLDAWCRLAEEAAPEAVAAALLPWLFSASSLARPERRHQMLRGLSEIVPRVPAATLRSMAAGIRAWSGTRQAELRGLSVRTLVIAGAEDLLTPGAEQLAESVAGAQRAVIPEAGHAVALEAAEAVNRAILQHLAAHASRGGSSRPGCHS